MAKWHLDELQNSMERSGWRLVAVHASNDIYISASWESEGGKGEPNIFIDFEGIDDLKTLPLDESYGCHLRSDRTISLYFGRKGKNGSSRREAWKTDVRHFAASLRERRNE